MIKLFTANDNDRSGSGITLNPSRCELNMKINDTWELTLENYLDDRWQYIQENAVLVIDTPTDKGQMYRIHDVTKSDTKITAHAYPIFLDAANEVFLLDSRPSELDGQHALNWLMAGTKYSGYSNIVRPNTAYYVRKNLIEALFGVDNCFLNRWGGEVYFDNYTVNILDRIGADNGVRVRTGLNLTAISEKIDTSSIVTRILPEAFNGRTLPETYRDSPHINDYPTVYVKVVKMDDLMLKEDEGATEQAYDTLEELYAAMRARCTALFTEGIDQPKISYSINMVDLSKTREYEQYKRLFTVNLGDTVHCKHEKLGITAEARIIELKWDCIKQMVLSLKLGAKPQDYFSSTTNSVAKVESFASDIESRTDAIDQRTERLRDEVGQIVDEFGRVIDRTAGTIIAEKISGNIDMMKTKLSAHKEVATTMGERAILFEDRDPTSPTYGAMSLGTDGFAIAGKLVNDEWQWTTLGTAGKFYATDIYGNDITGLKIHAGEIDGGYIYGGKVEGAVMVFGDTDSRYVEAYTYKRGDDPAGVIFDGNGEIQLHNTGNIIELVNYSKDNATQTPRIMNNILMSAPAHKMSFYNFKDYSGETEAIQSQEWGMANSIDLETSGNVVANRVNSLYVKNMPVGVGNSSTPANVFTFYSANQYHNIAMTNFTPTNQSSADKVGNELTFTSSGSSGENVISVNNMRYYSFADTEVYNQLFMRATDNERSTVLGNIGRNKIELYAKQNARNSISIENMRGETGLKDILNQLYMGTDINGVSLRNFKDVGQVNYIANELNMTNTNSKRTFEVKNYKYLSNQYLSGNYVQTEMGLDNTDGFFVRFYNLNGVAADYKVISELKITNDLIFNNDVLEIKITQGGVLTIKSKRTDNYLTFNSSYIMAEMGTSKLVFNSSGLTINGRLL